MQKFDILQRDLNVLDVHFLEASAGTGKTFAIEHMAVRLLLQQEVPIVIEQILVVTFTRASTRELRMRIRATLLRTKEALQSGSCALDYLAEICEQGSEVVAGAIKKIDAALVCFDAAQVFTLHGFCHRMLSEFAFEGKIATSLISPDESNPAPHYKRAVSEYLLSSQVSHSSRQLQIVLKHFQNDPFLLIKRIVSLLLDDAEIIPYPTFQESHAKFCAALQGFPSQIEKEAFLNDMQRLSACYKAMKDASRQAEMLWPILHAKECSQELFEEMLVQEEWFFEKMHKANLKVRSNLPSVESLRYPGIVQKIQQEIAPILQEARSETKILLRLAYECKEHVKRVFAGKEFFSPDQMLLRLEKALSAPLFLESIRKKYKVAIIDEFQDTDPIQWSIFKQVFLGHVAALCLVGDPKQSIYAFRSADIYTYLDAAQAVGLEKVRSLDTNYRSTPELVAALNALFSAPKEKGWLPLPRLQSGLSVPKVQAGRKISSARASLHFILAAAEKNLFACIASEIQELKKDVPLEEIAVLVKDRYQAQRLMDYLKLCAIPVSFRKGTSVLESVGFYALKELLEAVLYPSDISKLKVALGGPLIGWDDSLLCKKMDAAELQNAKLQMLSLQQTLYRKGFGPFFYDLLRSSWLPCEEMVGERILKNSLYQELRKLAEILIAEELQGVDFLHFLQEMEREGETEEQRFEIPPQEGKGSVALMTVHLSKGLEFDTVFALALASRHKNKEEAIRQGKGRVWHAYEEHHPECREAVEEMDAEKMRTLYVALTRAKQQVYIPFIIDEKPPKMGDASPIEIFLAKVSAECRAPSALYEEIASLKQDKVETLLSQFGSYSYAEESQEKIALENSAAPLLVAPSHSFYVPKMESVVSFSSLAVKEKASEMEVVPGTLPLGSATGSAIHRIFELIFKRRLHHPLSEEKIEALIHAEMEGTALAPWKEAILKMVLTALDLPLNGLKLSDVKHYYQELEFLFPIAKGMMKGFADLFFWHEDKYYLLDWKTNYLPDYSQEAMQQAMQAHDYFLQASIYATALKRYVKLFDNRPFEEMFGGAFYVFLRGGGVFHFIPEIS